MIPITFCKDCKLIIDFTFSSYLVSESRLEMPGLCPRCGGQRLGVTKEERPGWGCIEKHKYDKLDRDTCYWGM